MKEDKFLAEVTEALGEHYDAVGIVTVKRGRFGKAIIGGDSCYPDSIQYVHALILAMAELTRMLQEKHGFIPWDDLK